MTLAKSCWDNFTQSAYRPTDQKNFPKMSVFEKISLNLSQQRPLISNFTIMTIVKL
jgi:hypothetical protein